jgi:hypothetical protein
MGEDKTKILGDEGPTEELVAQKAATTNPMLEAILARMNEGFAELDTKLAQLNAKVDALTLEVREIKGNQRVFNDQRLRVQSHLIDHQERLLNLEPKAS